MPTEHYGDKVKLAMAFAELLNQEARALEKDGVDVIQFDEPAFNVYMDDVKRWGIDALHRAIAGVKCTTCVHICYGYGIQANLDWKKTLGESWRQYEQIFPALAKSKIKQVSLECIHSRVPMELMKLLKGKDVLVGVIDVASDRVETPQEVAKVIQQALKFVPARHLYPVHQLRHGADGPRRGGGQAAGARRRRGARAQEARQEVTSKTWSIQRSPRAAWWPARTRWPRRRASTRCAPAARRSMPPSRRPRRSPCSTLTCAASAAMRSG